MEFLNESCSLFLVTFKYISISKDKVPQNKNPINRGRAVFDTNLPIKILKGTAIIVEINPVIAAPIPDI